MGDFKKWGDPSNGGILVMGDDFEMGGWYPFTEYDKIGIWKY